MTNDLNLIRAAAFQAQSERLDFRTKGVKKCNPPNRKCGDRCIPPNWDCRLRGEGNDPHLKAAGKGSDPISGFANLERGFQRFGKAITRFSFSELEGSRRAVARGAAKLHPGDLKEKEKAKEKAMQLATWVGTPALVVIFAGLAHTGLKANRGYREGFGKSVDSAVADTFYNIRRNIPITGGAIRAREAAGSGSLQSLRSATQRQLLGAPSAIRRIEGTNFLSASSRRASVARARGESSGVGAIRESLVSVDRMPNNPAQPSRMSYAEWQPKSLQAYWSTKLPTTIQGSLTGDSTTNLFAVGASNNLLRRSYGLPNDISTGVDLKADAAQIVGAMTTRLREQRAALLTDMKQRNFDPAVDMDRYLDMQSVNWRTGDQALDTEIHASIKRLLQGTDTYSFAKEQYVATRNAFSSYFDDIGRNMAIPPDIRNPAFDRTSRRLSPYADGLQGHAEGLARLTTLNWPSDRPIRTPEMAELVRRTYHAKVVMGQANPTVAFSSVSRLKAVAAEISGSRRPLTTEEATEIVAAFLRPMGISGVGVARGRRDSYEETFLDTIARLDKRCGRSGIPDDRKCSKPTYGAAPTAAPKPTSPNRPPGAKPATPPRTAPAPAARAAASAATTRSTTSPTKKKGKEEDNTARNVAIGITAAAGAVALASIGIKARNIDRYRKNVAKSAIEAEKLSLEFERNFREQAARRLGKRPEEVTGFEASMYDIKDRGYDRGYGDWDTEPGWYGQTKNSAGAVVMLSYADDGDFTRRGQGSNTMAQGGVWNHIIGNRDVLAYSNNISQPYTKPTGNYAQREQREFVEGVGKAARSVAGIAGPDVAAQAEKLAKGAAAFGTELPKTWDRFKFLRRNVEEIGYNPDAVRAAAFVVAQRRLTGKQVDIMSYSNGGNVATETLAILDQMGYRDVKVINIAGPTFGMFKHSDENMRTWVSTGDEFYQTTRGGAFTGGNTTILKNSDNIPHGLEDRINPKNAASEGRAKEYRKEKASYFLNDELALGAYKFLHVNHTRSAELLREMEWRAAEGQPMEGDLKYLFGDEADSKLQYFKGMMEDKPNREANMKLIREEIEDKMLEKWYGGYDHKRNRNAAKTLRQEAQLAGEMQQYGYKSMDEAKAIAKMMQQKNADGSPRYKTREAAELAYRRERNTMDSPSPYELAFQSTLKLLACK